MWFLLTETSKTECKRKLFHETTPRSGCEMKRSLDLLTYNMLVQTNSLNSLHMDYCG